MRIGQSSASAPALGPYNPRLWLLCNPPSVTLRGARPELLILNLSLQAIKGVLTVESAKGWAQTHRESKHTGKEPVGGKVNPRDRSELPHSEEKWRLSPVPRRQLGSGRWISRLPCARPVPGHSADLPPTRASSRPGWARQEGEPGPSTLILNCRFQSPG